MPVKRNVTVRLPEELIDEMKRERKKRGVSFSAVMRTRLAVGKNLKLCRTCKGRGMIRA